MSQATSNNGENKYSLSQKELVESYVDLITKLHPNNALELSVSILLVILSGYSEALPKEGKQTVIQGDKYDINISPSPKTAK